MSGSGRRRGSKWDMKEDISPENRRDAAHSNNAASSFHVHESRDYMSGRRGFQRDERMNDESMLGSGHYTRRMSPGSDGRRPHSRSRSPRRIRGRSYRSRSKSRSRSRSPPHNFQREPRGRRSSSKSGHSAPLCRDFAAGRCKKGDNCRFAHDSSQNNDSRRHFEIKSGDGWESRRGNDGASRHHSDPYSGGRSTYICNDFLKGRCTRGSSCRFRHQDSGSDEFVEGLSDGSYRDGGNDWRSKNGSSYDHEAHVSSEPLCKFFASGSCRNGKHCKFSHQREEQFNSERRSPDGRQSKHNLEGMNRIWNDSNWSDRNSLRRVPETSEWEVEGSSFRDGRRSVPGEWSKEDLLNHELSDPSYMSGNEKMASKENQSLQWQSNSISVSETKAIEKGFADRKMLSPKGTFNSQMGLVGQRSDSLAFPQTSLSFGEQDLTQRASAENHYLSGIMQPNISGDYSQPNHSFPVDISTGARNNGASHVNVNILADIPHGQGIRQDGGFVTQPISTVGNVGQPNPSFSVDIAAGARNNGTLHANVNILADIPRGQGIRQDGGLVGQPTSNIGNVGQPNPSTPADIAAGARNNVTSHVNVNSLTDIPRGQSIRQDGALVAQPISTVGNVGQSQSTFPLHPPGGEHMQIAHHEPVLDATLAKGQSQSMFPYNLNQGMPMPHQQPVDSNPADGAYGSNTGISQAASGVALSQNSILNEQLAQYSHLSATLVQLLEKRQLPQLHAAITQQIASVPPVAAAPAQPILASELKRQYDPINDSLETKVAGSLVEQSSLLTGSEIPSLNCNPTSFGTERLAATGDLKMGSNGDEIRNKDHHLNVQGPAVFSEENGGATGKGANETGEALDQGPADDIALDTGADDGKKAKDAKGVRQFKFSLAEYVKVLLKPTWKGGQMSKEVHKTIVKKVVDKVTETIEPASIPRTREKIDQYLSLSKPKLSKLIQAYVEKYNKT